MPRLTWLITGCSSGFGEELVKSILERGDKVIATSRGDLGRMKHLQDLGAATLELDVCSSQTILNSKVQDALAIYGDIDVLVNNAGYIEAGVLEDMTHERMLKCLNTNLFGALNLARAVLPTFRQKKAGTIVWIGSCGGWQAESGGGPYFVSKFGMEGLVECLQKEIVSFGVENILFEPGYFRTEIHKEGNIKIEPLSIPEYSEVYGMMVAGIDAFRGKLPGDPRKAAERILDVVRREGMATGKKIPLRLPLGPDALEQVRNKCLETLKILEEWESVIVSTNMDP